MAVERWEVIERYVLLAIAIALVALAVWFAFHGAGLSVLIGIVFVAPVAFWVMWQVFCEGRMESQELPSRSERLVRATGMWARRVTLGTMVALFAFGGTAALVWEGEASGAMAGASLAIVLGWVALFGAGRHKSISESNSLCESYDNPGAPVKPAITLITLGVDDLERAVRFYRDGLGFPTKGIVGTEIENGAVAFFKLDSGLKMALWPRKSMAADAGLQVQAPSVTEFSLAHNVSSKEEVDATMALAAKAGATIVKPAHDTFYGGYAGYFQDPDGHLWEVAFNPGLASLG